MKDDFMLMGLMTLGDVLANESSLDPGHLLYLPKYQTWRLQTKCAVLDDSDIEDPIPELAQKNGLSYVFEIATVQDIVANAKEQVRDVSLDQLLQAFLFYYEHDAFIIFE